MEYDLHRLNHLGFIPGSEENDLSFYTRVQNSSTLANCRAFGSYPPTRESLHSLECLFDVRPEWVFVSYSNKKLFPWEGGATWLIEKEDGIVESFVQLREKFKKKRYYLWIYDREELLAHELVHAVRAGLKKSSKYEEIIAYQTARSSLRKFLGPLFSTPTEAVCFITSLALPLMIPYFFLFFPNLFDAIEGRIIYLLFLLPLSLFFMGFTRLFLRYRNWQRCVRNLEKALVDNAKSKALILRLTDEEIDDFANSNPRKIIAYAYCQHFLCLRWKMLWSVYFDN